MHLRRLLIALFVCAVSASFAFAAPFTPGNLVIYRVGDGSAALGSTATVVFVDEYTPAGSLVQSIALPTATSGANRRLTASGSATSEGFLSLSADGHYLALAGYDAAVGTAAIAGTASATTNRVVARIDAGGAVDTTTSISNAFSGGNPRGVTTDNGSNFWVVGSVSGVQLVTFGASSATQISGTTTNLRAANIFGGQLYVSTASGTAFRLGSVGSGMPTTPGQTTANLPGLPVTAAITGFFFADLDAATPGVDTLYVADDGAGQVQKFSLVGGSWTTNGNIAVAAARGLTATVQGSTVTLYGTSGTTGATLYKLTDASGYNATISGSVTTLASAGTNRAFRGVALAPISSTPQPTPPSGTGTANPSSVLPGASTTLTVTVTPGLNPTSTGISVTADLSSIGGSATQAFTDNGGNVFSFVATVAAGTSGGLKSLPVSIRDTQMRSGTTTISLTVLASTNPTGVGAANPSSLSTGNSTLLTVSVTPGTNPNSTGITVTGNLSSIGGAASQNFFDDASHGDVTANDNVFSFNATIPVGTPIGAKTIGISVADAQARSSSTTISLSVTAPTIAPGTIVISQIYGGGGNSGATLKNDFIELFNRSNSPVSLNGWSVQYAGSTAAFGVQAPTPLSGVIQPHSYFLVKEAAGAAGSVDLPTADVTGSIAMGATAGKIALVQTSTPLTVDCPTGADIMDFVGYGNTSCAETRSIGLLSNTTATFRLLGGCKDTNNNSLDFFVTSPAPRNSSSPINDCSTVVEQPPAPHVVISQIYSGGGNSGAVYSNDFVELYNASASPVNIKDWSIQYTSFTGSTWSSNTQPLAGILAPGEYFLIQLGGGTSGGAPLPSPRVIGNINMAATTGGKVALVKRIAGLTGNCPIGDPDLVDFLGYGSGASSPDCYEGGLNSPVAGNNAEAVLRKDNGNTDTNRNSEDFVTGSPNPRGSGTLVDIVPQITGTDPLGADAPRDASITVNFSESVTTTGPWFSINCTMSGLHTDVEVASAFTRQVYIITPNVTFTPTETCTVHINKNFIVDEDGSPDNLPADIEWTFTVAFAPPVETADVHLTMGNPSHATINDPNNYLMSKPDFALSYNRSRGTANWVSWHLTDEWTTGGSGGRTDTFRPDPAIPRDWYRVLQTDFSGSGFDRGHMSPSADRTSTIPINQATFLMTNMVPQSPDNNQGPWEAFESFLRTLLPANEVYIVSGPFGTGGTGSNGGVTTTLANGHVVVPASTWKVVLVLPKASGNDLSRVSAASRTIAIEIPNIQGIRNNDWMTYLTTVHAIEAETGYNFFSNVDQIVQNSIEFGTNGSNPPGAADEDFNTNEDQSVTVTLNAVSPLANPTFTYTIEAGPGHGTLTGSGASYTYTPAPDFNGTDTFTFHVSDGNKTSNTSTVTVHIAAVNDAPTAVEDAAADETGSVLTFPATNLTVNDSAGPADEASQTLTVSAVTATADTHGTVVLASGQVAYTPDPFFAGTAKFTYQVCDNGTPSQCATGTVSVAVVDTTPPLMSALTLSETRLWPPNHQMVNITVDYTVSDLGASSPTCTLSVSSNEPDNGLGDGDTPGDSIIVNAHQVKLRAERAASGDGRIYTITARCTDSFTNFTEKTATVTVPKNNTK